MKSQDFIKSSLTIWQTNGHDLLKSLELTLSTLEKMSWCALLLSDEEISKARKTVETKLKELKEAIKNGADINDIRVCSNCGLPMKEGFYLGGEYACDEDCALALYNGDKKQMDEDLSHACEADSECYYTEWETYFD